jgi:Flp pilus assembly pilin Flp
MTRNPSSWIVHWHYVANTRVRAGMKVTGKLLQDILRDEGASSLIEYVLLAALLALAAVASLHKLDNKVAKDYNTITKKV